MARLPMAKVLKILRPQYHRTIKELSMNPEVVSRLFSIIKNMGLKNWFCSIAFSIFCAILLFPSLSPGEELTLDECIHMAMENNFSVKEGRKNISLSQTQSLLNYSEILPYLSARSSVTRSSSDFGLDPYNDIYSTSVSVTQTIFDLSSAFSIKESRLKVKESMAQYQSIVRSVELLVAQCFYDYIKRQKFLVVKDLGLKESEENFRKTEVMYDVGTVSRIDLLRAEVVKNQSELDLLKAAKELEMAKVNLAYVTGLEPDLEFEVKEESTKVEDYSIGDYDSLFARMKKNNPDIGAQRLSVSAAKARLSSAYSDHLPTLSLSGSYGYSGDRFTLSQEEWDRDDSWSVGASVQLPLFTGFSRYASVRQSKISTGMEELGYREMVMDKGIELRKALLSMDEAEETYRLASKNLEKAELTYRMVKEKYDLGAADIVELIDAEQDYREAQVTKISSYFDMILASFYIKNLLGERIIKEQGSD
jgi:outer membrane protein